MKEPTPREREYVAALSNGLFVPEAAEKLGISRHTIYYATKEMGERYGTGTLSGLVAFFIRKGWIE
jgi:DNA-binding CsgD family transcriptional regulator